VYPSFSGKLIGESRLGWDRLVDDLTGQVDRSPERWKKSDGSR